MTRVKMGIHWIFFSASQTDCKHLTRHVAGKFHWLLGLALPAVPHQLCRQVPELRTPRPFQMGSSLGPGLGLCPSSLLQLHPSPWGAPSAVALKSCCLATTSNFLSPAQTFFTDSRLPDLNTLSPRASPSGTPERCLQSSVRKMEFLICPETCRPRPCPYSLLPCAQVDVLKPSVTLLSPLHGVTAFQTCPESSHLSPLPTACSLACATISSHLDCLSELPIPTPVP